MILELTPFLAFFGPLLWVLAGCLIFILAVILIVVILLQDSKDGGLGGAFGGGGMGGESLLGARGQKGVVKFTAIVGIVFGALVIVWGSLEIRIDDTSQFKAGKDTADALSDPDADTEPSSVTPVTPEKTDGATTTPVTPEKTDGATTTPVTPEKTDGATTNPGGASAGDSTGTKTPEETKTPEGTTTPDSGTGG